MMGFHCEHGQCMATKLKTYDCHSKQRTCILRGPLSQHLQGGSSQTSHFQSARGVPNHLVHIKQNFLSFPI